MNHAKVIERKEDCEMSFTKTRVEAIEKRRAIKASGRCSCFIKLLYDRGYFVQDCPRPLCKKQSLEVNVK